MSARSLARFIILSRSRASAFLLSSSSSGGIALNTPSIAMSFASAKLTFISCNSCSILSNVRLDKSFSQNVNERNYGGCTLKKPRRGRRINDAALNRPTASVCFRQNQPLNSILAQCPVSGVKRAYWSRFSRNLGANVFFHLKRTFNLRT